MVDNGYGVVNQRTLDQVFNDELIGVCKIHELYDALLKTYPIKGVGSAKQEFALKRFVDKVYYDFKNRTPSALRELWLNRNSMAHETHQVMDKMWSDKYVQEKNTQDYHKRKQDFDYAGNDFGINFTDFAKENVRCILMKLAIDGQSRRITIPFPLQREDGIVNYWPQLHGGCYQVMIVEKYRGLSNQEVARRWEIRKNDAWNELSHDEKMRRNELSTYHEDRDKAWQLRNKANAEFTERQPFLEELVNDATVNRIFTVWPKKDNGFSMKSEKYQTYAFSSLTLPLTKQGVIEVDWKDYTDWLLKLKKQREDRVLAQIEEQKIKEPADLHSRIGMRNSAKTNMEKALKAKELYDSGEQMWSQSKSITATWGEPINVSMNTPATKEYSDLHPVRSPFAYGNTINELLKWGSVYLSIGRNSQTRDILSRYKFYWVCEKEYSKLEE